MTWHPDIPEHYRNQIVTGDARELAKAIPDESIDLIFTDPVYDRIEDYEWLAETAARVLKPDSACLVFYGVGFAPETHDALRRGGLRFRWVLSANYAMRKQFHGRLQVSKTECLWYEKGRSRCVAPVGDSTTLPYRRERRYLQTNGASWDKHPKLMSMYTLGFSKPNAVILDPFCGLGSGPAYAMKLARNYIAFEIDPTTAELARDRVRNTQPPLLVPQAEQMALLED